MSKNTGVILKKIYNQLKFAAKGKQVEKSISNSVLWNFILPHIA